MVVQLLKRSASNEQLNRLIEGTRNAVSSAKDTAKERISNVAGVVGNRVTNAGKGLLATVHGAANGLKNAKNGLAGRMNGAGGAIGSRIANAGNGLLATVHGATKGLKNAKRRAVRKVNGAAGRLTGSLTRAVQNVSGKLAAANQNTGNIMKSATLGALGIALPYIPDDEMRHLATIACGVAIARLANQNISNVFNGKYLISNIRKGARALAYIGASFFSPYLATAYSVVEANQMIKKINPEDFDTDYTPRTETTPTVAEDGPASRTRSRTAAVNSAFLSSLSNMIKGICKSAIPQIRISAAVGGYLLRNQPNPIQSDLGILLQAGAAGLSVLSSSTIAKEPEIAAGLLAGLGVVAYEAPQHLVPAIAAGALVNVAEYCKQLCSKNQ